MSRKIALIGSGGHAKVIIGLIRALGDEPVEIYDDNPDSHGKLVMGVPIVGATLDCASTSHEVVIAIGSNRVRKLISEKLDVRWATLVHPFSWVDPSVKLGEGTVVFAGSVIQPMTEVGRHVILNTSASIDHDSVVADFVQVAPGAHTGGNVTLDEGCFLGVGASIIHGQTVGAWSVVGAGATVVRDVPPGVTVVGVPAHKG